MSNAIIGMKPHRVPNGATTAFPALAVMLDEASRMSPASAKWANVLEQLGLRKIDLFMFGLAAIWCAVGVAKIILQF
ncbi:MAG: hypothetical protein WC807_20445 [Hyphomicrobium sp.]|jgi:hypothetical protein